MRSWLPKSKRTVAGAALAAMMIGIVVNAVALQHGRRVEFVPDVSATSALRTATPSATTEKSLPTAAVAKTANAPEPAQARPAPTIVATAHSAKSGDEIADFLRTQGADKRRMTLSAQISLAKLGYQVKPTGTLDSSTKIALADFQKSHHMPVSAELSAKLVKSINAAAAN